MAGFFGLFDADRSGPGVPRNEPPKPKILVFLGILRRKLWKLVQLNLLYFLFNIPAILVSFFLATYFFVSDPVLGQTQDTSLRILICALLVCFPLITAGPVQAGFTFVLIKFAGQEHAFIWADFKESAAKNLRQGMIVCGINLAVTILIGFDIGLYTHALNLGIFTLALGIIFTIFIILFLMMQFYIYPMAVTYKLSIKNLFKNAFLLSMARFIPNLMMLILCFLIIYASFLYLYIGLVLFILITPSLIGLILNFYTIPTLEKFVTDDQAP